MKSWATIGIAGLTWLLLCGCGGGKGGGNLSLTIDCENLGGLPTSSGTMDGYFTFGGSSRYPLSIDLTIANRTFSGQARIQDSQNQYTGTCSGSWNTAGNLTGSCSLSGPTTLKIQLSGSLGQNGGCGDWSGSTFQQGVWRIGR
ncbi:MAG: hypothetical protein KC609_25425 [Myxococcales bacterium]|nr:hypothetical protein [Myxococcales bacterium]